jgi:isoquinoline 1-oxidoreductase beta subunit
MVESGQVPRREFLISASIIGTSLLVGCRALRNNGSDTLIAKTPPKELNAWVKIDGEGRVHLIVDKVEMGQGVATLFVGMAMDGLGVSASRIDFSFAPPDEIYINRKIKAETLNVTIPLQVQFTGYSTSTSDAWVTAQGAVMGARAKLIAAAAKRWSVASSAVTLADGAALEKAGQKRRLGLGELVSDAAQVDLRRETIEPLQPQAMSTMKRVDFLPKVTGKPIFGIDVSAATMGVSKLRYTVLVRSEEIGARLRVSNLAELTQMPGFYAAFPILEDQAFAIVADRYWQARKIAQATRFQSLAGPNANFSSEQMIDDYLKMLNNKKISVRTPLDIGFGAPETIALSEQNHQAEYVLPLLPHATLEPMNASCAFVDGQWSIWVPTQYPEAAESAAARVFKVKEQQVRIVTTYVGGGFGRRLAVDYVTLVASVAKELATRKGPENAAVKLVWSREEDFRYDYFRPIACHKIAASLDSQGISAWKQEIATQSITAVASQDIISSLIPDKLKNQTLISLFSKIGAASFNLVNLDPVAVEGAVDTDYKLGRFALNAVGYTPDSMPRIPIGYWRSVGHYHTCFAIESFIDELAKKFGRNEVELRRYALRSSPRGLEVLERCLTLSQYDPRVKGGLAMGLARHSGWGSSIAMVMQVGLGERGEPQVKAVWAAVDVGFALQPDIIRQQIEGGIIFGLSAALKQEIRIEKGVVRESNFYDAGDVLRLNESPKITVDIVARPREIAPTGVGELGVPCVAPALANAVHNLTGKRVRRLPLTAERLKMSTIALLITLLGGFFSQDSYAQRRSFRDGRDAFGYLFQVATSPRCANCHGAIAMKSGIHYPTVGDDRRPHAMAIDARFPSLGGDCTSCHQKKNQDMPRYPPGAFSEATPDFLWHMPPPSMVLATVTTPRQLCEQWTDPARNALVPGKKGGINDLATFRREFMIHAQNDPLVEWSFKPGLGRTPAPGSKAELVEAMDLWISWLEAGNRCDAL